MKIADALSAEQRQRLEELTAGQEIANDEDRAADLLAVAQWLEKHLYDCGELSQLARDLDVWPHLESALLLPTNEDPDSFATHVYASDPRAWRRDRRDLIAQPTVEAADIRTVRGRATRDALSMPSALWWTRQWLRPWLDPIGDSELDAETYLVGLARSVGTTPDELRRVFNLACTRVSEIEERGALIRLVPTESLDARPPLRTQAVQRWLAEGERRSAFAINADTAQRVTELADTLEPDVDELGAKRLRFADRKRLAELLTGGRDTAARRPGQDVYARRSRVTELEDDTVYDTDDQAREYDPLELETQLEEFAHEQSITVTELREQKPDRRIARAKKAFIVEVGSRAQQVEIARTLGVSRQYVWHVLREAGIQSPPPTG
jgi:hypothetical protein